MVSEAVLVTAFVASFGLVKLYPARVLSTAGEFRDACVHLMSWVQVMQNNSEVLIGLVVGHKRIGRCRYEPQAKQELARQMPDWSLTAILPDSSLHKNIFRVRQPEVNAIEFVALLSGFF